MSKPWDNFNSDFEKSRKRFNFMFNVALGIIALTFMGIIAAWILAGTVLVKSVDEVEKIGLKTVIERIWCGPNAKCL